MAGHRIVADLLVPLDTASDVPLSRQVYNGLRDAILRGDLAPGTRLPSSRRLAAYLAVSRTTVLAAYERLVAEQLVVGAVGSGSRVSDHLPAKPIAATQTRSENQLEWLSATARVLLRQPHPERRSADEPKAFRTGQPPVDVFPIELWRRLTTRHHRRMTPAEMAHGAAAGLGRLREAIATMVVTRGIRCTPQQVFVVSSAQEGLELASRLLLGPGEAAWIEDPGWSGARAALAMSGAQLVPVPVDDAGIDVAFAVRRAPRARLAYVTPSHQYPLGVTLDAIRRRELIDWAESNRAWIIEDDYDSEFRYAARPLPALASLDGIRRVIYVGTFNKILFPALRLAYLILPESLVGPFEDVRRIGGVHAPTATQAVLTDFIVEGHYSRHLARARVVARERRDALVDLVRAIEGLVVEDVDTGLHIVGWLAPGLDDRRVSAAALERGVEVMPLSACSIGGGGRAGLVLGYGSLNLSQIRAGVAQLAAAVRAARSG